MHWNVAMRKLMPLSRASMVKAITWQCDRRGCQGDRKVHDTVEVQAQVTLMRVALKEKKNERKAMTSHLTHRY